MISPPRRKRRSALGVPLISVFALLAGVLAAAPASAGAAGTATTTSPADKIESAVTDALERKNAGDFWVRFAASADTSAAGRAADWTARGQQVVDALTDTATTSQAGARKVLDTLGVDYEPYWITNAILVRDGTTELATQLAAMDAVSEIRAPRTYEMPQPVDSAPADRAVNAVEWGIANINADDVWSQYGVSGQGIVVANIDSGVDYDHPALVGQYRGNNNDGTYTHDYNWFDATGTSDVPFDGAGSSHGTHTMGTMVGDDGGANQIGVAPGAQWIAANGCNTCSDAHLIASGQWMLAPTDLDGQNPDVSKRPHIVNNSWGTVVPTNDPFMEDVLQEWANAGIFGVWSNGNSGPACSTSGSPGSRILNYSVGAYDIGNNIASFSARGPGQDGEIKPNIAAPGVNVRSATNNGNYGTLSGTSMSAPHVAGSIALLWSAAPALVGDIAGTRALLDDTAVDVANTSCGGTTDDNNVWGEGRLDALALIDAAPTGDTGVLAGTVRDSAGTPVAGAALTASGGIERTTRTAADGTYSLILTSGSYDVSVSAFGYVTSTTTATVVTDQTTTHDVILESAEAYPVSGTVTDAASGEPVSGATVTINGTPIPPTTTGADGGYTFESVPAGTYTLTSQAGRCTEAATAALTVDGPEVLDFALPKRTDSFGYYCSVRPSQYVEGTTPVALSGDDAATSIDLPFAFPFYGESYTTAHLATNGHVNFLARSTAYSNTRIPNAAAPNAALYPLWDDLVVQSDSAVYTGQVGGGFVIEYRNVAFYGASTTRVDFEVIIYPNGRIAFAYRNIDPANARETGSSATVGIENATGTDGLEYSFNEAGTLSDDVQIEFALPPNGTVSGTITDANDAGPVSGATIRALAEDGTVVRQVTTANDGSYDMLLFFGAYTIEATKSRYTAASAEVVIDEDGETNTVDLALTTGVADIDPASFGWTITEGQTRSAEMTITNSGSADLTWEIGELAGANGAAARDLAPPSENSAPDARTAAHLYPAAHQADDAMQPQAPGDVLTQWPTTGINGIAWGVGYNRDVWVSDAQNVRNHQFATDGTPGAVHPASYGGVWSGDMAADTSTGAMCQVNVGGDNGIHCFDPATGEVQYSMTGSPWSGISQRGLAYNPSDDTFYIGGWNEGIIYTVAGQSHASPGATLAQCATEDGAIAGLAYNPTADVIWMVNSAPSTTLYQISPADCSTVSTLGFPESGQYPGAGLDLDHTGALWMVSQSTGTAYLVDSGVPAVSDVQWLSTDPTSGSLGIGESANVTVTVDTTGLEPGVYNASILVTTTAGRVPAVQVPVRVVVPAYQVGVNAGGAEYTAVDGDLWRADQPYSESSGWGFTAADSKVELTTSSIAGTEDDPLFQSQRVGGNAYQFDDVPAGTYVIDLGFAELKRNVKPDKRVFDVTVNGEYVLVGHDVAGAVGALTADEHHIVVEHDGGTLTIGFEGRRSYDPPIVSALRVTERPDR